MKIEDLIRTKFLSTNSDHVITCTYIYIPNNVKFQTTSKQLCEPLHHKNTTKIKSR